MANELTGDAYARKSTVWNVIDHYLSGLTLVDRRSDVRKALCANTKALLVHARLFACHFTLEIICFDLLLIRNSLGNRGGEAASGRKALRG